MDNIKNCLLTLENALLVLDKVFNQNNFPYRVIGSTLIAAINGKPHRTINDIDIVVDEENISAILDLIQKEGYILERKNKLGMKWLEAKSPNRVGFTFMLVGKFDDKGFTCNVFPNLQLRVSNEYIKPTTYELFGIKIVGIPPFSIKESLKISNLNPKRSLDKRILTEAIGSKEIGGETLDHAFKVFLFNKEIPHLYSAFSHFYNLYGGARVFLGKKYEIWD